MFTKEIKYNTVEYRESLRLRSEILRVPLGKALSAEDVFGEGSQLHFGCFSDDQLIGCVVAKFADKKAEAKLRQMAVAKSVQGKGVGKKLVQNVEVRLKERGIKTMVLSARKTAIAFYERLGYEVVGEFYLEQSIEHIRMQKTL